MCACAACYILIINNGKLVVYDTIKNINRQLVNQAVFVVRIAGDNTEIENSINSIDDVSEVVVSKTDEKGVWEYTITPVEGRIIKNKLIEMIYNKKMDLISFESKKLTLEDIFRKVTETRRKTATKKKGDN